VMSVIATVVVVSVIATVVVVSVTVTVVAVKAILIQSGSLSDLAIAVQQGSLILVTLASAVPVWLNLPRLPRRKRTHLTVAYRMRTLVPPAEVTLMEVMTPTKTKMKTETMKKKKTVQVEAS
jgi:ABC-type nickel/cobalt efflux system permease component RcnA